MKEDGRKRREGKEGRFNVGLIIACAVRVCN